MFTGLIHGVSDSGARGLWPYTDREVSSPKPSVHGNPQPFRHSAFPLGACMCSPRFEAGVPYADKWSL